MAFIIYLFSTNRKGGCSAQEFALFTGSTSCFVDKNRGHTRNIRRSLSCCSIRKQSIIHMKFSPAFYKRQRLRAPAVWETASRGWRRGQNRQPRMRRMPVLGTARGDGVEGQRPRHPPQRTKSLYESFVGTCRCGVCTFHYCSPDNPTHKAG